MIDKPKSKDVEKKDSIRNDAAQANGNSAAFDRIFNDDWVGVRFYASEEDFKAGRVTVL